MLTKHTINREHSLPFLITPRKEDKNGKIVTDHENIGTKNYGRNPKSWEHIKFDVIPYYIWGNSPDDTTPLFRRIYGYH